RRSSPDSPRRANVSAMGAWSPRTGTSHSWPPPLPPPTPGSTAISDFTTRGIMQLRSLLTLSLMFGAIATAPAQTDPSAPTAAPAVVAPTMDQSVDPVTASFRARMQDYRLLHDKPLVPQDGPLVTELWALTT